MANTRGFEVVAEAGVSFLREVIRAAWKSGGTKPGDPPSQGVIPEYFDIPPGLALGPYTLADGQVQIPQGELDVAMAPPVNGIEIKFGLHVQVHLANPPVPSAELLSMTADVRAKCPVQTLGGTVNVGIVFTGLPRANVTSTLTSGDPVSGNLDTYLAEYVHGLYEADGPAFPHEVTRTGVIITYLGFNTYQADASVELFDDPTNPARRIEVSRPTPAQLRISIPLHLRIYNIQKLLSLAPTLLSPMGVDARLIITAPFVSAPGSYTAQLTAATVTTENLVGAGPGNEGPNYNANKATLGATLDTMLANQINAEGQQMAQAIGDITLQVPTVGQIEVLIGDVFHQQLVAQGSLSVWTPDTDGSQPVQVNDVTVRAQATALALAINAGAGADANALTDFIPAGRSFAVAIDGAKVLAVIDDVIHSPESEGGFGPNFPPKRFSNVDGHDADLTRLDISLIAGAIHMEGDVTVIDAVAGSIDVDASFAVDVGLHWEDNADGTQRLASDPGAPDVDLSLLAWIVSFLIGFITLGLVGGIIAIVILIIVESIAERVGGTLVRDQVTNKVTGIGAWPAELKGIGNVQARFGNPVGIESDGLVFSG